MTGSELMWNVFRTTGYIGAYLFFKELQRWEEEKVTLAMVADLNVPKLLDLS